MRVVVALGCAGVGEDLDAGFLHCCGDGYFAGSLRGGEGGDDAGVVGLVRVEAGEEGGVLREGGGGEEEEEEDGEV